MDGSIVNRPVKYALRFTGGETVGRKGASQDIRLPHLPQPLHRLSNRKRNLFLAIYDVEDPDSDSAYEIPARAIHPPMNESSLS
jgi:hypothetical protein